jgi:protein gp37
MNDRFKWIEDFDSPQWFDRLHHFQTRKPKSIFINSMSDIAFWDTQHISSVLRAATYNPQNRYIALTKDLTMFLGKMQTIRLCGRLPAPELAALKDIFYIGETITHGGAGAGGVMLPYLSSEEIEPNFINIEPILTPLANELAQKNLKYCKTIIIGAETGNRKYKVVPEKKWVDNIVKLADERGVPVFMKNSLRGLMGADFRQDRLIWEINK